MAVANSRAHEELAKYYEALGPIRDLVLDDSLTEIMVNGPKQVYVERNGKILLTDRQFDDDTPLSGGRSSSSAQSGAASTSPAPWPTLASGTAAESTPSFTRWPWTDPS